MREVFLARGMVPREIYTGEPNKEIINPEPGTRASNVIHNFNNRSDEEVIEFLLSQNYINPRKLADGSWVALYRLAYTLSVCTDITPMSPYAYRWCFSDPEEAKYFLDTITEFDEIPVRRESLKGHRFHHEYGRMVKYDQLGFKQW